MITNLDDNGMISSSKMRIYNVVMLLLFNLNTQLATCGNFYTKKTKHFKFWCDKCMYHCMYI